MFEIFSLFSNIFCDSFRIMTVYDRSFQTVAREPDLHNSNCFLNSCKLKNIELCNEHINRITIEAFAKKASSNPKTYYKFIARTDFNTNHYPKKELTNENILKNLMIRRSIYLFCYILNTFLASLEFNTVYNNIIISFYCVSDRL
jgi:hypothetical protein